MKIHHRIAAGLAFVLGLTGPAWASAAKYPDKPITIIVPFAVSGGADTTARLIAAKLSTALGQSVVVQNMPGGSGMIASNFVAKAPKDGYTLLLGTNSTHGTTPAVLKVNYDPVKDFAPIAVIGTAPVVLLVAPNSPHKTMGDLLATAKAKPGQVTFGSSGMGGISHLNTELFMEAAGVKLNHIPYKTTTASYVDVIAGRVDMVIDYAGVAVGYAKNGSLRALAVSTKSRIASLPQTPTFEEAGVPNYYADIWIGLFAPAGTPKPIVDFLNAEVRKAVVSKDLGESFATTATVGGTLMPEEFAILVQKETDRWPPIVKKNNIKAE